MKCAICAADHGTRAPEKCQCCGLPLREAGGEAQVIAGRYELQSFLGRGGMGAVFRAHDHSLEEVVALKVLRLDVADSGDMAKRFRSEIRIARRVRHPNVCAIHEYGEDGAQSYIAMELVEGETLKQLLQRRGGLAPDQAFDVAIQLCSGIEAIHITGVVHRDLKTSNVMLDRKGQLRVMDFGIAKKFGDGKGTEITLAGQIIGTPEYMSPEQARGEDLDARSDIYAIGVILFEIFTGRVPFYAETPIAIMFKQIQELPPLDEPFAQSLPVELRETLRKVLAKDREDRIGSAGELARLLEDMRTRVLGTRPWAGSPDVPTDVVPEVRPSASSGSASEANTQPQVGTRAEPAAGPAPRGQGARLAPAPPVARPQPAAPPPTLRPARTAPALARSTPRAPLDETGPLDPTIAEVRLPTHTARVDPSVGSSRYLALGLVVIFGLSVLGAGAYVAATILRPTPTPTVTPPPPPTPAPAPPGPTLVVGPTTDPIPIVTPTAQPTASPTRSPAVTPTPRPTATPTPTPTPTPVLARGNLQLRVLPWAEVELDGKVVGTTPISPQVLAPGRHVVVLRHPDYEPVQRVKNLDPGETWTLDIDLPLDALRKQP